jgi:hypothetical protein
LQSRYKRNQIEEEERIKTDYYHRWIKKKWKHEAHFWHKIRRKIYCSLGRGNYPHNISYHVIKRVKKREYSNEFNEEHLT